MHDLLDMIEFEILKIDYRERITSTAVVLQLKRLREISEKNPNYYYVSVPRKTNSQPGENESIMDRRYSNFKVLQMFPVSF